MFSGKSPPERTRRVESGQRTDIVERVISVSQQMFCKNQPSLIDKVEKSGSEYIIKIVGNVSAISAHFLGEVNNCKSRIKEKLFSLEHLFEVLCK